MQVNTCMYLHSNWAHVVTTCGGIKIRVCVFLTSTLRRRRVSGVRRRPLYPRRGRGMHFRYQFDSRVIRVGLDETAKQKNSCEIWGSHSGTRQGASLLGSYALPTGKNKFSVFRGGSFSNDGLLDACNEMGRVCGNVLGEGEGGEKLHTRFYSRNLSERDHLEDLRIDRKTILKCTFKKWGRRRGLDWSGSCREKCWALLNAVKKRRVQNAWNLTSRGIVCFSKRTAFHMINYLWILAQCTIMGLYQHFGELGNLHLQGNWMWWRYT